MRRSPATVSGQCGRVPQSLAPHELETGDRDGYAVWRRIIRAIEELQRTQANGAMH